MNGRKKQPGHNSRVHATKETPSELPGSEKQEMLHCEALQDLSFLKPLLSRAGNITGFSITEKRAET